MAQLAQFQQLDRGSSGGTSDAHPENTHPIAFRPTSTKRPWPRKNGGAIEGLPSDGGETSGNLNPIAGQVHSSPRRDESIRSGIKELLEANKEAQVIDTNTATVLESLLSRMDQGSTEGLVLPTNNPPTDASLRVRQRARFVDALTDEPSSLTTPPSGTQGEEMPAPKRSARRFRSSASEGETVWWESHSKGDITAPACCPDFAVGDLYIHRNVATATSIQIWICQEPNTWKKVVLEYDDKFDPERVISGLSHPLFEDRRLRLRKSGEPSWITKQTCMTNKSRRKEAQ